MEFIDCTFQMIKPMRQCVIREGIPALHDMFLDSVRLQRSIKMWKTEIGETDCGEH